MRALDGAVGGVQGLNPPNTHIGPGTYTGADKSTDAREQHGGLAADGALSRWLRGLHQAKTVRPPARPLASSLPARPTMPCSPPCCAALQRATVFVPGRVV